MEIDQHSEQNIENCKYAKGLTAFILSLLIFACAVVALMTMSAQLWFGGGFFVLALAVNPLTALIFWPMMILCPVFFVKSFRTRERYVFFRIAGSTLYFVSVISFAIAIIGTDFP